MKFDIYKDNRMSAVVGNTEIMGNENNLYLFPTECISLIVRQRKQLYCRRIIWIK